MDNMIHKACYNAINRIVTGFMFIVKAIKNQ